MWLQRNKNKLSLVGSVYVGYYIDIDIDIDIDRHLGHEQHEDDAASIHIYYEVHAPVFFLCQTILKINQVC
jgi:hypothetical protein